MYAFKNNMGAVVAVSDFARVPHGVTAVEVDGVPIKPSGADYMDIDYVAKTLFWVIFTPEQQHTRYEALTAQYIHAQYPIDKEQAITRKAIAYPADEAIQAEFGAYNAYAEDCKARARGEVFGA